MKKKRTLKKVFRQVSLIKFLLLLNLVLLTLMRIIVPYGTELCLKASKYSYITLQNLPSFLSLPLTIVFMILLFLVVSIFFYIEIMGIIIYYGTYQKYTQMRTVYILYPALVQFKSNFLSKKGFFHIIYASGIGIVATMPVFLAMLFRQRIPNYFMDAIWKNTIAVAALIVLLIVLIIVVYEGAFTVFYDVYEHKGFKKAYADSVWLLKGNQKRVILSLVKTNLFLCFIYVLVYIVLVFFTGVFAFLFVSHHMSIAVFLTAYDMINRYYALALGVLGIIVNLKALQKMYEKISASPVSSYQNILLLQKQASQRSQRERVFHYGAQIICILWGVMTVVSSVALIRTKTPLIGTYITAHRGYSAAAPENTLPAIQEAIDVMSDYAEIDVQETKDGIVVLLHDSNLKRTTGINKNIWNVTYEELLQYDFSKGYRKPYEQVKVATLEEVLDLCKDKIFLNIELKINQKEMNLPEKVVQMIMDYGMEDQCIISSTSYTALSRVKAVNDKIKTGYILSIAYGYFFNSKNADFFSMKSSFITNETVLMAHQLGKEIHAWTVNSTSEVERMKQLGVDNIITDDPIHVREVLYQNEFTSSFLGFLKTFTK